MLLLFLVSSIIINMDKAIRPLTDERYAGLFVRLRTNSHSA